MTFHLESSKLVSDNNQTAYHVNQEFRKVLQTLPDSSVPNSIVMLGILTNQLIPIGEDAEKHVRIVSENIDDAKEVVVPAQTVKAVEWLLSRVKDSLNAERKQMIGQLINEINLTSTAGSNSSSTHDEERRHTDGLNETSGGEETHTDTIEKTTDAKENCTDNVEKSTTAKESPTDDVGNNNSDKNTLDDDRESFVCEFCSDTYYSESNLLSHSIQCEERPPDAKFKCQYCNNKYISKHALENHIEDCEESGDSMEFECENCGKQFDSIQKRIEHNYACNEMQSQSVSRNDTDAKIVERGITGTVTSYNGDDTYGFITTMDLKEYAEPGADKSVDVFFHLNQYPDSNAQENDPLKFDVKKTDEGFEAINISRVYREDIEGWERKFASTRVRWGKDT